MGQGDEDRGRGEGEEGDDHRKDRAIHALQKFYQGGGVRGRVVKALAGFDIERFASSNTWDGVGQGDA